MKKGHKKDKILRSNQQQSLTLLIPFRRYSTDLGWEGTY
jgi:hypothetical protein